MRLAVAILDPAYGGGVAAIYRMLRHSLERLGIEHEWVYWALPTGTPTHRRSESGSNHHVSWHLPLPIQVRGLLPGLLLRGRLQSFDRALVASAYNEPAAFPYMAGLPYACWCATTLTSEWGGRRAWDELRNGSRMLALHRAFLPVSIALERHFYAAAGSVLGMSRATERSLLEQYQLPVDQVGTLYFPVPPDVKAAPVSRATRDTGPFTVIGVGRVEDRRKDFSLLVEAFGRMLKQVTDAQLILCGRAGTGGRVAELVSQRGLEGHVRLAGEVEREELLRLYRRADALVIPSRQEGFGIVALEAMASGLPVVSTRCGGPEDLVADGISGLLVEPGDAAGLTDAILRLAVDPALRHSLGEAGRERARTLFSMEQFMDRLGALLLDRSLAWRPARC